MFCEKIEVLTDLFDPYGVAAYIWFDRGLQCWKSSPGGKQTQHAVTFKSDQSSEVDQVHARITAARFTFHLPDDKSQMNSDHKRRLYAAKSQQKN